MELGGLTVMTPGGIWLQLGCFWFCVSGLFGDLLIIRLCLVLAHLSMLVSGLTGIPLWPAVVHPGFIALDGVLWSVVNLFFHGLALGRLVWDERRITLRDAEHQQLWQFFYRRSGMFKLEFQESMRHAVRASFGKGEMILDSAASAHRLMLLVDGLATFQLSDPQGHVIRGDTELFSGSTFDIGLLNVFGVYMAFERHDHVHMTCRAVTDCTVYFWDIEDLNTLATRSSPSVSSYWRNFALCQVGLEGFHRAHPHQPPVNGRGWPEPGGVVRGVCRSTDFTDPLAPYEDPRPSLRGVLSWLPTTLAPFLPPGMRHNAMPRSGVMARNRLLALSATARADKAAAAGAPLPEPHAGSAEAGLAARTAERESMESAAEAVLRREPRELRAASRRILRALTPTNLAAASELEEPLLSQSMSARHSLATVRSGLPPALYTLFEQA